MHDRGQEVDESAYVFDMHSGLPHIVEFRRLVEQWLLNYPDDHLDSFLSRFQAQAAKDDHYHAAMFELFLHEHLRGFADRIEIESAIPGSDKRADFGLHFADGGRLLVEALAVQRTRMMPKPNLDRVMGYVGEMESTGFVLYFDYLTTVDHDIPNTHGKAHVQNRVHRIVEHCDWYNANAHAEITGDRVISVDPLKLGDWSIGAWLYVKRPDERLDGPLLAGGRTEIGYDALPNQVRNKILKKIWRKTSGHKDVSFVLAVNIHDRMSNHREGEPEILYGLKGMPQFPTSPADAARAVRSMKSQSGTEGVWATSDGHSNHERCSAIWFFHQVGVEHPTGSRHTLHLNPFVLHESPTLLLQEYVAADARLSD